MNDLISRKDALSLLTVFTEKDALGSTPAEIIKHMPSVDPVVHGKWIIREKEIRNGTTYTRPWLYECSNCGERPLIKHKAEIMADYCPCCGAKMDFLVMDCPDGEKGTE